MPETIELVLNSNPRWLQVVRALADQVARAAGLPDRERDHLKLAVGEACANIIVHSYGGDPAGKMIVTFCLDDQKVEVVLRDFGKKVRPEDLQPRDLDEIRPGGLGVHLIRCVMDEVEYDTTPEQGTALRLVKYLAGPSGSIHGRQREQ